VEYLTLTIRIPRQLLSESELELTVDAPAEHLLLDPLLLEELFWRGLTPYRCSKLYGGTQMTYRRGWLKLSLPVEIDYDERRQRGQQLGYDFKREVGAA
jgi:hypothetical protein